MIKVEDETVGWICVADGKVFWPAPVKDVVSVRVHTTLRNIDVSLIIACWKKALLQGIIFWSYDKIGLHITKIYFSYMTKDKFSP